MSALFIDWSEWDGRLGKKPDRALAREIGCAPSSVRARRKELGIPAFQGAVRPPSVWASLPSLPSLPPLPSFRPGGVYRFRRPRRGPSAGENAPPRRLRYLWTVRGNRADLHLFRSEAGGYNESFTPWQLEDYLVDLVDLAEEVA